jgi:hypothetical protein
MRGRQGVQKEKGRFKRLDPRSYCISIGMGFLSFLVRDPQYHWCVFLYFAVGGLLFGIGAGRVLGTEVITDRKGY